MACMTGRTLLDGWVKQLIDAGVAPPETRRLIIDIPVDDVVKVYYECYGDEKMFTTELAVALQKADIIRVPGKDDPNDVPVG